MNAKLMFGELGYSKLYLHDDSLDLNWIRYSRKSRGFIFVVDFFLEQKGYIAYVMNKNDADETSLIIDMDMNKAIQQQMKELKWI